MLAGGAFKSVVIVSPYFPPSTLAGVHRARHLAKHLPASGWRPIVLCVDESNHTERLDPALAALVPDEVEIEKVGAIPAKLTRLAGVGDISLRAWSYLKAGLKRLLDTGCVDVALITGSPFYPMMLAPDIKRRYGTPIVLDFQDPWVSNWGSSNSPFSKSGIAHRLATLLEPRALRYADFVTSVSDVQNEQMRLRYPWLDASRMAAIPIGGDAEDFAALRDEQRNKAATPGLVELSYVGTVLPRSGPLFTSLLRAYARLRSANPILASKIRLNFVGTSNQPNDNATLRILPLAETLGVADAVNEIPNRVPYLEALGWLARSNGLLLVGSDEPHYTASKIYPALMSGRPFLSIFHRVSSAHEILSASGGGRAIAFDNVADLPALEAQIADALALLASSSRALGRADPSIYRAFEAKSIAARFANIFTELSLQS